MRSSDALTALIQAVVDELNACGYDVCATARAAVAGPMPCCIGDQCGQYTVTGSITRRWRSGKFPTPIDPTAIRCSWTPAFEVQLTVGRCIPDNLDTAVLPDDAVAAELADVLDCIDTVWGCASTIDFRELLFLNAVRQSAGTCAGWLVTLNASW